MLDLFICSETETCIELPSVNNSGAFVPGFTKDVVLQQRQEKMADTGEIARTDLNF